MERNDIVGSPDTNWFLFLPAAISLAFSIGLLLFVALSERRDENAAKQYVLLGLALMATATIASAFGCFWLTHLASPTQNNFTAIGILNVFTTLLHFLAVSFLGPAAFTGRTFTHKNARSFQGIQPVDINPELPPSD